ncbi:hypothetical protein C1H46_042706 [Malus baccata]|uniref:START domain-containing protein n=1 Tax=Malus baccata TaxID=106549 RepID=A0A540KC87_MALBA|nr:hypothetical protein C1H46_042706 [Malus baccata]
MYGAGDLLRSISASSEADKPMILELAVAAMDELIRMAQMVEPLWMTSLDGSTTVLNEDEYIRTFPREVRPKQNGFKTEASRESAVVIMNHMKLVEILMDVMTAEFQVPSPLVPTRESYYVRPSGCLIQEMPNGNSKVTWVEHADEVDERGIHHLYKQLVSSGHAFGAKRWVATLDRQCERLASAMASNIPTGDVGVITNQERRKSVLKWAERMVISFCAGLSASTTHTWTTMSGIGVDDVRVMTRKCVDDLGRPAGIVLRAAASFCLPVPPKRVFEFLRNEKSRSEWDILSYAGIFKEIGHIAYGRNTGNCVSLLLSAYSSKSNMLILQESCTDPTASFVLYAPVDIVHMKAVLNGSDPDHVPLLPSGFAILPDGAGIGDSSSGGSSLLTVAFQLLIDSDPTAKLSLGSSVTAANDLIDCTGSDDRLPLICCSILRTRKEGERRETQMVVVRDFGRPGGEK